MAGVVSPELRVVRAVKQNEKKAAQLKPEAANLKAEASQMADEAAAIKRIQRDLESQIQEGWQLRQTRTKLQELKASVSGQAGKEKIQMRQLLQRLEAKRATAEEISKYKITTESKAGKAEKAARRAETVSEANKRNVSKEKERSKPWEERAVPIKATTKMTESLKKQDKSAETIKFYSQHGYEAEPRYVLPIEDLGELRTKLTDYQVQRKHSGWFKRISTTLGENMDKVRRLEDLSSRVGVGNEEKANYERQLKEAKTNLSADQKEHDKLMAQASKEVDSEIISVMPFYEVAVKQAEKDGKTIDRQQFIEGVLNGVNITGHRDAGISFFSAVKGRASSFSEIGYGTMGSGHFNERFNRYNREAPLSYVMGYSGGVSIDKTAWHLARHLKMWIAENIAVSDGESGEAKPLGPGYFITKNMGESVRDRRELNALNRASEISSAVYETLKDHRLFDEANWFIYEVKDMNNVFGQIKPPATL